MKKTFDQIFRNVFVITIERNRDRRLYMEKALHGLEYSFYYGLDLTTSYLEYPYVANRRFLISTTWTRAIASCGRRGNSALLLPNGN